MLKLQMARLQNKNHKHEEARHYIYLLQQSTTLIGPEKNYLPEAQDNDCKRTVINTFKDLKRI